MMNKQELIRQWKNELYGIKEDLYEHGDKPDSLLYSTESSKALRLSECITDLVELDDAEKAAKKLDVSNPDVPIPAGPIIPGAKKGVL